MAGKKQSTFTIDTDVKKEFKVETTINGVDMSETLENFMKHYCEVSKKLRKERESKKHD